MGLGIQPVSNFVHHYCSGWLGGKAYHFAAYAEWTSIRRSGVIALLQVMIFPQHGDSGSRPVSYL
jgi:hypothetical protein